MKENHIKISAKNIDEFNEISSVLSLLPDGIREQITTAEKGLMGVDCTLKKYSGEAKVLLPSDTTQISDFGDYIGIYSSNVFLRLPKIPKTDAKFSYIFASRYKIA